MSSTHLIFGRTKSYGDIFLALNTLSDENVEVLELFPVGNGGHFICECLLESESDAQNLFSSWKQGLEKDGIAFTELNLFTNLENAIIDCYLSLQAAPELGENLLVLESSSIIDVIKAAQLVLRSGGRILDLRFLKGSEPKAICLATNSVGVDAKNVHQTFLKQLNSANRSYFNSIRKLHHI